MKKTLLSIAVSSVALGSITLGSIGVQAEDINKFVSDGSIEANFRLRAETVSKDPLDDALAVTLKSRVTLTSGEVYGLSALVEGDNTTHIIDNFLSPDNNNTQYNTVVDPETTQLNQIYVQYKLADTTVKLGNQRINLDNQRHIGGVAFRQDEATFDALTVTNTSITDTTIFFALSNNQNTIKDTDTENDATLVNVKYQVNPDLATTGYYYDIADSSSTIGVRAVGKVSDISYEAEFATQDQDATNASPIYYHLAASKNLGSVKLTGGFEVLGSDGGNGAFSTSFGTNHKFLGWSDTYIQAPNDNGIQDLYVSAVTKVSDVKLVGQLHTFSADEGSADLGNEIGFLAAKQINNYGVSVKLAQFNAGDAGEDATKVWFTGTAKF